MRTRTEAKLYGIRGSAPAFAPELMLHHKGIPYRRVNLVPGRHQKTLPAKGFPGRTVPALTIDGRRSQTNRSIARTLDELVDDAPLFPSNPEERVAVERAERFGDEIFQQAVRRMVIWSLVRDPKSVRAHPAIGRLPIRGPAWMRRRLTAPTFRQYRVSDETVAEDFRALPGMLDLLDRFAADGVLDGPRLNAADFQIAPLVAAIMGVADAAADVGARPIAGLAARVMPA